MRVSARGPAALAAVAGLTFACSLQRGAPPVRSSTTQRPPAATSTAAPASVTTSRPTPSTAGQGSRGLPATDRLEREHPLAAALPHETPNYRIDFSVRSDGRLQVRVTLLAILNNARDLAGYEAQLRRHKAEALAFIQAQGEDPAGYSLAWFPAEAAAL